RPLVLLLAAGAILFKPARQHPGLWFCLTLLTVLRVTLDWPLADNHAYLLSYWCLAVGLSLAVKNSRTCLALNGRLLIAWVFLFATAWKLFLSPDFMDARFFRVTFILDERFEGFARLAGGLSLDQLYLLRDVIGQHVDGPLLSGAPSLDLSKRFLWLAHFTTYWTVLIEGLLAMAFFWPKGKGLSKLRDLLLICFCATTYAIATVDGFGWLLIAMGVAQCDSDRRRTRLCYLGTFALILFYREVPWAEFMLDLVAAIPLETATLHGVGLV
ncbi:MAG: hypothetical protein JRC77_11320, partial [Deltaproteobacteria bacterium]|nr:hypothetical protein [Deltaproteobacteria bacterium]